MESVQSVVAALRKEDFLLSIAIKEAYLHMPNFLTHQKFLQFAVKKISLFSVCGAALWAGYRPSGVNKGLNPSTGLVENSGVSTLRYLDDLLLREQSVP